MLEPLVNPPLGFEEVLKKHFALCRQRIVAQARRWTLEAEGTQCAPRFEKVYNQILGRLSTMELHLLPPLAPIKEDIDYLLAHDPNFFGKGGFDQKPAASPLSVTSSAPLSFNAANPWSAAVVDSSNPWAGAGFVQHSQPSNWDSAGAAEDEDDFYS